MTDQQLLRDYSENRNESAFAELVRRYIDFVHSAAVRMVRDDHSAEDVTQAVFVALAQNAWQLRDRPVLAGWLHRTAQNLASKTVRTEVRRRVREQKAAAMNELLSAESDAAWDDLAPQLDAALGELSEADRDAVLLRYFQQKSAVEMAQTLGISGEAAQKRVSRAVERLREFLVKRGVTVGAGGLAVILPVYAVKAAPVGLAATVSAAAVPTTTTSITAATVGKSIVMTTVQKTFVAAVLVVAIGTGGYEAHQARQLREQNQTFREQQATLNEQLRQLQQERDEAKRQGTAASAELAELKSGRQMAELLKLRGEAGSLRRQLAANEAKPNASVSGMSRMMNDPASREFNRQVILKGIKSRYAPLFQELKLTPEQTEEFSQLFSNLYMKFGEVAVSAPPGTQDTAAFERATEPLKADFGKQLESLLGSAGYARFTEFSGEIPARATVSLLNDQLGGSQLNAEQNARLLEVVKAEPYDLMHGIEGELNRAFLGSPEQIDQYLQKVAESNRRILQGASAFLEPSQLLGLSTVLSNGVAARVAQGAAYGPKR